MIKIQQKPVYRVLLDMGLSNCSGEQFTPGPMAWFVDQLIEDKLDFSYIDNSCCRFIPKEQLIKISKSLQHPLRFSGKKQKKETGFFYNNAKALEKEALSLQAE